MSKPEEYILKAAFRLPAKGDTLGMPLFASGTNNILWSVETDDFLKIKRFAPFTRDSSAVEWIDEADAMSPFRKGDYAPIPVWIRGEKRVFPGGVSSEDIEFDIDAGESNRSVFVRLAEILARARRKELISSGEPEEFWQAFRFLSQNFSGGRSWVRRLTTVLRQSPAYFRPTAVERDILVQLMWRWVDLYIGKVSLDVFKDFIVSIRDAPFDFSDRELLLNTASLERLLRGNDKWGTAARLQELGFPNPPQARAVVAASADTSERARRLTSLFDTRLSAEVERRFNSVDRRADAFNENIDDLAALVHLFGHPRLPNEILFRLPIIVKTYFDRMRLAEKRAGRSDEFELLMFYAETFARMGGGDRAVDVMRRAYEKGV
jgi:hypothetical protein